MTVQQRSWFAAVCLGFLLVLAGCTGESPEDVIERSQAQFERQRDSLFTDAIDLDGWVAREPRMETVGHPNEDQTELFGSFGNTPTEFVWLYDVNDELSYEEVMDLAAAFLIDKGATMIRDLPGQKQLAVETGGDRLRIELFVTDRVNGTVMHTVQVGRLR